MVDPAAGRHAISPLIYGLNSPSSGEIAAARPGLVRLGGNRWTAYNWETNASNAGSDFLYQNDGYLSASNSPGQAVLPTVAAAQAVGAATMVTVPVVDYVAADKNGGGDVRNSGADYLQTRFRRNHPAGGPAGTAPNAADGNVYQDQFVRWLGSAAPAGSKLLFSLDNEPDLWAETHPEVHPGQVTYAELGTRNTQYAAGIKSARPGAEVTGPASYGWAGYESLQGAPDAGSHGNFLDWYLGSVRGVDDLDLHYYPEATGGGVRVTGTDTSAAVVDARLQAPRSLWDRTYVENSWITRDSLPAGDKAIRLIPRTQARIAAHHPGTGLAITEWSFGGGGHWSGALATADALGIFGRGGLRAAAFWPLNPDNGWALGAFSLYRNYDGRGGRFGDTSVRATTSDTAGTSVYAGVDAGNPARMVLVAINKKAAAEPARISIRGSARATRASVYRVGAGGSPTPARAADITTASSNAFTYTMPARSASVIVPALSSVPSSQSSGPPASGTSHPALPAFRKLVRLPSARRCLRRRRLRLRLKVPRSLHARRAVITVNGRTRRVVRGRGLRRSLLLRRLPRGRVRLRVTVVLSDGRRVRGGRRYRTCAG